jgi:pentatricopeptide repeat protein
MKLSTLSSHHSNSLIPQLYLHTLPLSNVTVTTLLPNKNKALQDLQLVRSIHHHSTPKDTSKPSSISATSRSGPKATSSRGGLRGSYNDQGRLISPVLFRRARDAVLSIDLEVEPDREIPSGLPQLRGMVKPLRVLTENMAREYLQNWTEHNSPVGEWIAELQRRNVNVNIRAIHTLLRVMREYGLQNDMLRVFEACKSYGLQLELNTYVLVIGSLLASPEPTLSSALKRHDMFDDEISSESSVSASSSSAAASSAAAAASAAVSSLSNTDQSRVSLSNRHEELRGAAVHHSLRTILPRSVLEMRTKVALELFLELTSRQVPSTQTTTTGTTTPAGPDTTDTGTDPKSFVIPPTLHVLNLLIRVMCACWAPKREMARVLDRFYDLGVVPDLHVFMHLISASARRGAIKSMEYFLKRMYAHGISPDLKILANVIYGYGRARKFDYCLSTFSNILRRGFEPTEVVFIMLFDACGINHKTQYVSRMWHELRTTYHIEPTARLYCAKLVAEARCGDLRSSVETMLEMRELNVPVPSATVRTFARYCTMKMMSVRKEAQAVLDNPSDTKAVYRLLMAVFKQTDRIETS